MQVFATLCERTRGPIVYCADDKNAMLLCSHCENGVSYGVSELANYRALDVRLENFASRFSVLQRGQLLGEITLGVPGAQNVSNALGVVALATELGIAWTQVVSALAEFRGAARRFEVKYHSAEYMVVDDYAHHPTEVKATPGRGEEQRLEAGARPFSSPHRYSRTKALMGEFAGAFHDATEVFITEIYAASEAAMAGVTGESLAEAVPRRSSSQGPLRADPRPAARGGERAASARRPGHHAGGGGHSPGRAASRAGTHLVHPSCAGGCSPKAFSGATSRCTNTPPCASAARPSFGSSPTTRRI